MLIRQRFICQQFENELSKQVQSGSVSSANTETKIVFVLDRNNMDLLACCNVDKITGDWITFVPFREDEKLLSICRDEGNTFNADIYDRTSLCTETYIPNSFHNNLIIG